MIPSLVRIASTMCATLGLALAADPAAGAARSCGARETVRLWPGVAPGPTDWPKQEVVRAVRQPDGRRARVYGDVVDPTLTVVRPAAGRSNGVGIIILPGGAFMELAWDKEGIAPAEWLAARGYTAFALKYRVRAVPFPSDAELGPQPAAFETGMKILDPNLRVAIADTEQAVRTVRANAARFGVSPDAIGLLGFSAGATTSMDVVLEAEAASRPDFAGVIYGAMEEKSPPAGGPPLFIAAAQDDDTVPVEKGLAIFEAWQKAGLPAELHVYETGGHGFGLGRPATTSLGWPAAFEAWLRQLRLSGRLPQIDKK